MANSFELINEVVRDSVIVLQDNAVASNLVQRSAIEGQFANKVGKTIKVKTIPDLGTADEFTSTTSSSDVSEPYREITMEKHFYKKVELTSDEKTYSIDDFNALISGPMALSLKEGIDSYFVDKISAGFARNLTGTAGSAPVDVDDILSGKKAILDARGTFRNMAGLIGTTAEKALLQVATFISADYGPERPQALRESSLGRLHGVSWFTDQNVGTSSRGDVAGTVLVDGAVTAGATSITMDAFTNATGTVKEGTRFTVVGSLLVYTVQNDAIKAGNEVTLQVFPAFNANISDNAAVTFLTAHTQDVIFNTNSVYGAIIAPQAFQNGASAVANLDGMSLRASFFADQSTLKEYFILDCYAGCKVIHPSSGAVIQA